MYEMGLMDGNGLALLISNEGEMAKFGDFLESEVELGLVSNLSKNFSGLSTNLDSTLESTDSLMINLNKLVIDESDEGLKKTISELNATLKGFKQLSYSANSLVSKNDENIAVMLANFKTTSENLAKLSTDLKDANLGDTVEKLNTTVTSLNSLLANLEKGEGSIGKLLKDEALYNNLKGASGELEALLEDIKLHPKRYFRILSKKEIPYQEENTK